MQPVTQPHDTDNRCPATSQGNYVPACIEVIVGEGEDCIGMIQNPVVTVSGILGEFWCSIQ